MTVLRKWDRHCCKWKQFFFRDFLLLKIPSLTLKDMKLTSNFKQKLCSYTLLYRKRKKKKERKIGISMEKNNKCLFPLVSCLWICTALEKCINHFVHGTLKKLEIFYKGFHSLQECPHAVALWFPIYTRGPKKGPLLQLLLHCTLTCG